MRYNDDERRSYNFKLLISSFKDDIKKKRFAKKEFVVSFIGIFVGFVIKARVNVSAHIHNYFFIFLAEILIISACILLVRTIVWATEKFLRRS